MKFNPFTMMQSFPVESPASFYFFLDFAVLPACHQESLLIEDMGYGLFYGQVMPVLQTHVALQAATMALRKDFSAAGYSRLCSLLCRVIPGAASCTRLLPI